MYLFQYFFRFFSIAICVLIALITFVMPGSAGECLNDSREVLIKASETFGENKKPVSVRFRDYLCRARSGNIRVQFHRIDDRTISELISGIKNPSLTGVFGNGRLLKNSVYKEYSNLLKLFGEKQGGWAKLSVNTPTGGSTQLYTYGDKGPKLTVLISDWEDQHSVDFSQPDALLHLFRTGGLPKGFRGSLRGSIWTYMKRRDADNYYKLARRHNKLVASVIKDKDQIKGSGRIKAFSNSINMLKHLSRKGWPKYFAVIVGQPTETVFGCGGKSWHFNYYRRQPIVDVMVIENTSRTNISIDALLGQRSRTEGLRDQRRSKKLRTGSLSRLAGNLGTLRPGQKLIIPTRITFNVPPGLKSAVSKLRKKPKFVNYAYGPEVAVRSLVINGEQLDLEGNSANFLQLTSSCECGSCPYLYAYDEQAEDWRKLGKIIHKAKGKDKEETEIRELDGLVTKFRLAEEEAELAYIDHVSLSIELKSGRKLLFEPGHTLLKRKDGLYRRIYFGQSVNVNFTVPDWLNRADVKSSRFSVTGYYDRYSDILLQSALPPVYSPVMLPE